MAKSNTIITIIILTLIALAAGWYIGQEDLIDLKKTKDESQEKEITPVLVEIPEKPIIILPELDGLEINIPDEETTVQIKKEMAESDSSSSLFIGTRTNEENKTSNTVTLVDNQLTAVDTEHFIVPFLLNTGGTGTFLYLGLLENSKEGITSHTQSIFLGDRIGFEKISVENGTISVKTLERHGGQPFSAEPFIPVINNFALENNRLMFTKKYVNVTPSEIELSLSLTTETLFPIELTGFLPENWFFEGDFPITVLVDDETVLETFGTRTESAVENNRAQFSASLHPKEDLGNLADKEVSLMLTRNNASDEHALDASHQIIIAR